MCEKSREGWKDGGQREVEVRKEGKQEGVDYKSVMVSGELPHTKKLNKTK